MAMDVTSLSATIEVLSARYPHDRRVERAVMCVERLLKDVEAIIEPLRER